MVCLIYGSYIDGSENLRGSTQNALFEIMHFGGKKRTKKICKVRPAVRSAGWAVSATWSEYALNIPSAWVSSLAQCKSKNPFSLQRAWARLPLEDGIFWMQYFNAFFSSRRPEVENWHKERGVNDTFVNLMKALLKVSFHSWNDMHSRLFLVTSAVPGEQIAQVLYLFLKCLQTNPKSYEHLVVSWFVVLLKLIVVWIQKSFLGTWPDSVLHPNWVKFLAALFGCETWLVQQSFAVSAGAHVVFWL